MSRIFVCGLGAVSPAGWGVPAIRTALTRGQPLPTKTLDRPGWQQPPDVRPVPPFSGRSPFLNHPRLRRASPISQFAVAAAVEALADAGRPVADETSISPVSNATFEKLGIVLCVMAGCVNYTRRFYAETLKDPATASPLVFPETVFNAPASHIASVLGTGGMNYTLAGDPGTFLTGVALAAHWISDDCVDGCLVIGAEELDWLTADALRLFSRSTILSEGAGALYLRSEPGGAPPIEIRAITDSHLYTRSCGRRAATQAVRSQMPEFSAAHLLCDSRTGDRRMDRAEEQAWGDWNGTRLSPKKILGEGLATGGAWQCIAAVDALRRGECTAANISITGCNQQAIGAHISAT